MLASVSDKADRVAVKDGPALDGLFVWTQGCLPAELVHDVLTEGVVPRPKHGRSAAGYDGRPVGGIHASQWGSVRAYTWGSAVQAHRNWPFKRLNGMGLPAHPV